MVAVLLCCCPGVGQAANSRAASRRSDAHLPAPCPPTARTHWPALPAPPPWDSHADSPADWAMIGNRNSANGPRRSETSPAAAHKSDKHTPMRGQSQASGTLARRRRPGRDAASAQHTNTKTRGRACSRPLPLPTTSKEAATRLPHTEASRVHRGRPDLPSQPDFSCYWSPSRQKAPHTP
jgi:hypothetical protein